MNIRKRRSDRSGGATVVTMSTGGGGTRRAATVLGSDRVTHGGQGRCAAGRRNKMVPEGRRHATSDVWTIGEAALRPVSLVCGAGGDRAASRAGLHAGGRSRAGAGSVDDLAGATAQRRHPKRRPRVSRDDSAMARRASCSPSKAGEARAQHGIASLCGGTTGWRHRSERGSCSRPGRILEGPSPWTTARPAVRKRLQRHLTSSFYQPTTTLLRRPLEFALHAAERYRRLLAEHALVGCMGRPANPYGTAKAESFMKTLEVEAVYLTDYETF